MPSSAAIGTGPRAPAAPAAAGGGPAASSKDGGTQGMSYRPRCREASWVLELNTPPPRSRRARRDTMRGASTASPRMRTVLSAVGLCRTILRSGVRPADSTWNSATARSLAMELPTYATPPRSTSTSGTGNPGSAHACTESRGSAAGEAGEGGLGPPGDDAGDLDLPPAPPPPADGRRRHRCACLGSARFWFCRCSRNLSGMPAWGPVELDRNDTEEGAPPMAPRRSIIPPTSRGGGAPPPPSPVASAGALASTATGASVVTRNPRAVEGATARTGPSPPGRRSREWNESHAPRLRQWII
mmetsp:Transcript_2380/g.8284  ORF Transcript_2380/g.8284 Transcript_2380/m.8284 type:complete len:300 (+) Transcript_2380:200-1099(+)